MNPIQNKTVRFHNLGTVAYSDAWDYQTSLFEKTLEIKTRNRNAALEEQQATDNYLLFCEHPHVYTLGKSGKEYRTKDTARVRIKRITNYQLNATYSLHTKDQPSEKIVVQVSTGFATSKGNQNKKRLITMISVLPQKNRSVTDAPIILKAHKTKNGYRIVQANNIQSTSLWYAALEELIRDSFLDYACQTSRVELMERHYERITKKGI